jgi:hypothetical protein
MEEGNWLPIQQDGKYVYDVKIETGNYSWDATKKTVTTTPEEVARQISYGEYEDLQSKEGFRVALQAVMDGYKNQMGEVAFNDAIKGMGFSSVAEYIDAEVAEAFKNVTRNYAFSKDDKALFLDEKLPTNKGTNELTGETYYGMKWGGGDPVKDTTQTYVFTETDCTYTQTGDYSYSRTYIYAYDSTAKMVYLKMPTKGREAYYDGMSNNNGDDNPDEHNAAEVNSLYGRLEKHQYDLKEKTLQ